MFSLPWCDKNHEKKWMSRRVNHCMQPTPYPFRWQSNQGRAVAESQSISEHVAHHMAINHGRWIAFWHCWWCPFEQMRAVAAGIQHYSYRGGGKRLFHSLATLPPLD